MDEIEIIYNMCLCPLIPISDATAGISDVLQNYPKAASPTLFTCLIHGVKD